VIVFDEIGNCLGIVETFDIMAHTVFMYSFEDKHSTARQLENYDFSRINMEFIIKEQLTNKPIKKLFFSPEETLESLMEHLSYQLHRVLVTTKNNEGKIAYKLLSQWDVVKFLWSHMNKFDREVLNKTVKQLKLVNHQNLFPVWCITSDESALYGFKKMYFHKVNAIAVINDKGILEENLSASDLLGITGDTLPLVQLPVMEFLKKVKSIKHKELVTCTVDHHFKDVVTKAMLHKIHRVWIGSETSQPAAMRPIGVITLTDIIRTLLEFQPTVKTDIM